MLTLHARTNVPLSSAWLPTLFQQPPKIRSHLIEKNWDALRANMDILKTGLDYLLPTNVLNQKAISLILQYGILEKQMTLMQKYACAFANLLGRGTLIFPGRAHRGVTGVLIPLTVGQIWAYFTFGEAYFGNAYSYFQMRRILVRRIWRTLKKAYLCVITTKYNFNLYYHIRNFLGLNICFNM